MTGLLMFAGAIALIIIMFVGLKFLLTNTTVDTKGLDRDADET